MEQNQTLNAATWLGRHQAFGLTANKCSAADAAYLREIRDNRPTNGPRHTSLAR
jgi:hypothetical protein